MKIDLEPTWTEILNMVKSGHLDIKYTDLEKACQVADIVRKAQKDGKGFVKFVFEGGEVLVEYEEVDSESDEPIQTEAYQDIDPNSTYGNFPETTKLCECNAYQLENYGCQCGGNDLIEETDYLEEDDE